jgi:hypothetical protein
MPIPLLLIAVAMEKEPQKDENPKPIIGGAAPRGYCPYDDKGNYIPPGYPLSYEIER